MLKNGNMPPRWANGLIAISALALIVPLATSCGQNTESDDTTAIGAATDTSTDAFSSGGQSDSSPQSASAVSAQPGYITPMPHFVAGPAGPASCEGVPHLARKLVDAAIPRAEVASDGVAVPIEPIVDQMKDKAAQISDEPVAAAVRQLIEDVENNEAGSNNWNIQTDWQRIRAVCDVVINPDSPNEN